MKAVIVGRTNTGKSSLFNRITKSRSALVFDEEGITRDILKERVSWWGESFEILDSGGWTPEKGELSDKIHEKIFESFKEGDIFIVVADGKAGPQPSDTKVLDLVRKTGKPFLFFVNKVDNPSQASLLTADFYSITPTLLSGSCEKNLGIADIIEWILQQKKTKPLSSVRERSSSIEIFVTGKANSGKSLLCNRILGQNRMIVSSQAGTTLDTVKSFFSWDSQDYALMDNPGSRRGHREERERLSYSKSQSQMTNQAHIVLIVIDSQAGPGRQDARLVRFCLEKYKPVILIANKWDLLQEKPLEERKAVREQLKKIFHFCPDLPVVFMSAKTGYKRERLFEVIADMKEKMNKRIPTSKLNDFLKKVIKKAPAPVYGTSNVKFYYITQNSQIPPGFITFANYPKGVTASYKRFILSRMKKHFGLEGVPLRLHILSRK